MPLPTNEHYEACQDIGHTLKQKKKAAGFYCQWMKKEEAEFYEKVYLLNEVKEALDED